MSGMQLQFITETTIGPKERRIIRSHVMKGKNAGRPRPSRKRVHNTSSMHQGMRQCPPLPTDQFVAYGFQDSNYSHILDLKRLLWNDLILASFPHRLSAESMRLIHHWHSFCAKALYPPEFCTELNVSQYVWFQYVFEDKANLHCLLAVSASFTDHFGGNRKMFPEAISHISQAYRLTNERLSGPEACSDKAITAVTMLAIYQRMHHKQSEGLVHLEGLRRMIQLRGGLARLMKENRALAQKPWRLALEFALQDGSTIGFDLFEVPGSVAMVQSMNSPVLQLVPDSPGPYRGISPEVLDLLLDITDLAQLLNNTRADAKQDPLDYSEMVLLRLHRLLVFAPLGRQRTVDQLDDLVHLSLVAIMTSLLPEYGHNQARYDILSRRLRGTLHSYAATARYNHQLFLWAVFVGYATVLDDKDCGWLAPLVVEISGHLNLHSWADIRSMLCRCAWICVLYDKLGTRLWSESSRGKEAGVLSPPLSSSILEKSA